MTRAKQTAAIPDCPKRRKSACIQDTTAIPD